MKFIFIFFVGLTTGAQDLDEADIKALRDTQDILVNPKRRETAVQENEFSKSVHEQAHSVSGNQHNLNSMYGISSEIMAHLVEKYNGDSQKLSEALMQANKDPEAFYKSLPDPLQNKVRGLAGQVPQPVPQAK